MVELMVMGRTRGKSHKENMTFKKKNTKSNEKKLDGVMKKNLME